MNKKILQLLFSFSIVGILSIATAQGNINELKIIGIIIGYILIFVSTLIITIVSAFMKLKYISDVVLTTISEEYLLVIIEKNKSKIYHLITTVIIMAIAYLLNALLYGIIIRNSIMLYLWINMIYSIVYHILLYIIKIKEKAAEQAGGANSRVRESLTLPLELRRKRIYIRKMHY